MISHSGPSRAPSSVNEPAVTARDNSILRRSSTRHGTRADTSNWKSILKCSPFPSFSFSLSLWSSVVDGTSKNLSFRGETRGNTKGERTNSEWLRWKNACPRSRVARVTSAALYMAEYRNSRMQWCTRARSHSSSALGPRLPDRQLSIQSGAPRSLA